jgi:hypothetical protein
MHLFYINQMEVVSQYHFLKVKILFLQILLKIQVIDYFIDSIQEQVKIKLFNFYYLKENINL